MVRHRSSSASVPSCPLFLPSILHEIYAMLKAKGKGRGFFPEVITVFEEYAGVEARIDGQNEDKAP